ncbi:uncharacterized protein A4U43_C04F19650 [Asparagus officinalis]|uniref:Uncharacterized protein n=1 Tax=Asparagus officinalis TaxID=4686 RepID=A0A5P1F278_ASPOF|nr:uncharacterized protein A4U43_C04F19650 [Asparagus officinalis]
MATHQAWSKSGPDSDLSSLVKAHICGLIELGSGRVSLNQPGPEPGAWSGFGFQAFPGSRLCAGSAGSKPDTSPGKGDRFFNSLRKKRKFY